MHQPFMGYRRPDGDVGLRNKVAIIAAMDNSNPVVRRVAASLKGTVAVTPASGRGNVEPDLTVHRDTLVGLGTNPNIYGAVVVSLEGNTAAIIAEGIARTGRPVYALSLEQAGGTIRATEMATRQALRLLVDMGKVRAEPFGWDEMRIGLKCGGSDGSSGLAANPATGCFSDAVVARGGTMMLSETFEIVGGEHLLAARCCNEAVRERLLRGVHDLLEYTARAKVDIFRSNPSPDNIVGGLSTIEEKALGGIKKGGSSPIMEVVDCARRPTAKGLVYMDAPAPGVENITSLAAGGCQVILFTTGQGNTIGCPVAPTIKICGSPESMPHLADNIDVDVSGIISQGLSLHDAAGLIEDEVVHVGNGKMTRAEILGEEEITICRFGQAL